MEKKSNIRYKREQKIINYLKTHKTATTNDLSKKLNVSEVTIRRAIKEFEKSNYIERFHGGIKLVQDISDHEMLYVNKDERFNSEKKAISKKTMNLIEDGDVIFVNSGSTTLNVLKELNNSKKNVQVITNNAMAPAVIDNDNIELLILGGEYRSNSKSIVGENAVEMASGITVNKCILGINGINANNGVFTAVYQEVGVNKQMIDSCDGEVIIVADHSKIGKLYNFKSANITQIDILIIDEKYDKNEIEKIKSKGVKIITS